MVESDEYTKIKTFFLYISSKYLKIEVNVNILFTIEINPKDN